MNTEKFVELINKLNYNVAYRDELKDRLETFILDLKSFEDLDDYEFMLQIGIANEAQKKIIFQDMQEKINIITAEITHVTTEITKIKYQLVTLLNKIN